MIPQHPDQSHSAGNNCFHDHLDVCQYCRENPITPCDQGRRELRATVESGYATSYDRTLDREVNKSNQDTL